jgi:hypothetical protein
MAKSKKTKSSIVDPILTLSAAQSSSLHLNNNFTFMCDNTFKDCEWCFQFDDNEPHVFASTKPSYNGDKAKISFTLTNQTNTNITFKDTKTGREFKLFAREKSL